MSPAEEDGADLLARQQESVQETPDDPVGLESAREKTYYSISEISQMVDVRPHVLRYWETQFPMLRPRKGRSGSRMYREREVEIISRIKTLLYDKGFTIKGARRRIRLERKKELEERQLGLGIDNPWLEGLSQVREELIYLLEQLRGTRGRRS